MTRRELLGMASVGVVAIAVAGRYAWIQVETGARNTAFRSITADAQWRAMLSPASYHVVPAQSGTEAPFSSPLLSEHRQGYSPARDAGRRCSGRKQNMTATPAGRASGTSFRRPSYGAMTAARDGADRDSLRDVRRPSRPCLQRWTAANRPALLYERRGADNFDLPARDATKGEQPGHERTVQRDLAGDQQPARFGDGGDGRDLDPPGPQPRFPRRLHGRPQAMGAGAHCWRWSASG